MLKRNEFEVLSALAQGKAKTQRALAECCGLSLGSVNAAYHALAERGLVEAFEASQDGLAALDPYKVDNAVIMAAGLSSRFAPISYEHPKGVLRVKGEVLIERQIRQLREAGVSEIVVVVGYMKEAFFYLEDLYGVKILVNNEYATRNNNSTLMRASECLGNTYICSSDNYFTENVFEPYVYRAYYAVVHVKGPTDEWCVTSGASGRIADIRVGGADADVMLGHAYFDRKFSRKFVEILKAEYDLPETPPKLWEDMYRAHVRELDMVARRYGEGVIYEFDSLADLKGFDLDILENLDSRIFDNIERTLKCSRNDIADIVPIKQGMTNLSFRFTVGEGTYVYRHPGIGTDKIINRKGETFAQKAAYDLGIDTTYLHEDPREGWKISRFIRDCRPFDYHNADDVRRGLELGRRLHGSKVESSWTFDIHEDTKKIIALLDEGRLSAFRDFDELFEQAERLDALVRRDGVEPCLCHNDFYENNFLVNDECFCLIDWEYAGMGDYASDLGVFVCCSDYTYDEALEVFGVYFGRPLSPEELRHCVAFTALTSYHWFIWALYQDMTGNPSGEYLYLWYRYTKLYAKKAFAMYEAN